MPKAISSLLISRQYAFGKFLAAKNVYFLMQQAAEITRSGWQLTYSRTAEGEPVFDPKPRAVQTDGSGYISRDSLRLEITLHAAEYAHEEELGDPLENWFGSIELREPFGWRGGTPSETDRHQLSAYADFVLTALKYANEGI